MYYILYNTRHIIQPEVSRADKKKVTEEIHVRLGWIHNFQEGRVYLSVRKVGGRGLEAKFTFF